MTFPPQTEIVEDHVADARERGASVRTGGERIERDGDWYPPTVITDVDHSMKVMGDESFGPVVGVMKVRDAEEAVRLANDTRYGLSGYVFGKSDRGRGGRPPARGRGGVVNDVLVNFLAVDVPMGGWKDSGIGFRHGEYGIKKFVRPESLVITRFGGKREALYFPYTQKRRNLLRKLATFTTRAASAASAASSGRMAAGGVQYLALLRGINVGGKNAVAMAELREEFEELGFADVATYINSGNVLFRGKREKMETLSARIEKALTKRFKIDLKVVVLTEAQMRKVVADAPKDAGHADYRWDAIFVRKPLTVKKVLGLIDLKEGVDRAWAGKGVVYFSRLDSKASSSRLSKFAGMPEYKDVTVRNWNSTTKLLKLMDERASD